MSKTALKGINRIILRKVATILGTDRHKGLKMKTDGLVEEIITRAPDASSDQLKAVREIPELQDSELAAIDSILSGKKKGTKPKTKAKTKTNGEKPTRRRSPRKEEPAVSSSPGHEDLVMRLDALSKDVDTLTELVKAQAAENALLRAGLTTVVCCVFEPIDDLSELVPTVEEDAGDPQGE